MSRLPDLRTTPSVGVRFGRLLCGVAVLAVLVSSPGKLARAAEPDPADVEFFEKSIRPILVQHCFSCHSRKEPKGGLVLDTPEGLKQGGDTGPVIVPKQPDKSLLIEAVRYKNTDLQMPPKNRLSAAEVAALERWVARGAVDPRPPTTSTGATSSASAPTGMSIDEGRAFWSFKSVGNPSVPEPKQADWVRTPIDAFVLARLEANGLSPAPEADKRTLLRRVTFNLTGLPPTRAEIADFLADKSPNAWETVIERLLASPSYGVRWGRHWLDVARYADSNGLDENLAFGNAWRYRDYVVQAFNSDKPFDRFLVEQLAGDQIAEPSVESRTATGFLVLGAKVLAEPDREKLEMDTIDEQLDTIGKAFLGMTLGCVRCHDHKFDPLKQTDYYGLATIFKGTQTFAATNTGAIKHWNEFPFGTPDEAERLKAVDAEIAEKKKLASTFKSEAIAKIRTAARKRGADYLALAARLAPEVPLTVIAELAERDGLHPHILHHCRLHAQYHRDDPFFARWYELKAEEKFDEIGSHYRALFERVEQALAEARKTDPKASKIADAELEAARVALNDPSGFLAIPAKVENAFDAATLAEYNRLADAARIVESQAPDVSSAMAVADGKVVERMAIHVRGNHRSHGAEVARSFPAVMLAANSKPELSPNRSGRLELAEWLVRPEHPLTARVYVNRLWRWHFGVGIVESTENFGKLGSPPSHPELLDWLAKRLVDSGWSTKQMHRLILSSSVYRMAASHPQERAHAAVDPENRLLWKARLQRLDAEQIRDSVLAVTDRLDPTLGGKSIPLRNRQFVFDHTSIDHTKYDSLRRAIYLPVVRNNLYSLFEQFDFPDPTMPTGSRNATVVAPQALLMLNADLVLDSANAWAHRLLAVDRTDAERVRLAYEQAYGRPPRADEVARAVNFVEDVVRKRPSDHARADAWSLLCQSLLASNEFIYLR